MKRNLTRIVYLFCASLLFLACKKEAGSGGTSAITGKVTGTDYSEVNFDPSENEVTHITIPDGADIADAEYVILNTPIGGSQYYLWFDWVGGVDPDPGLTGRTGIPVIYDFTETNAEVAANAASAIQTIAGADFVVDVNNDIITLTNITAGEVPDADELSSYILVDVENQGSTFDVSSITGTSGAMVEERVYLIYGDEDFYSESVRTDDQGMYQFKELNRGDYKVVVYSADINYPYAPLMRIETSVTISNKKEVVEASTIDIVKL